MRPPEDPRRWAVCSALAVALLLAAVFLIPAAWIDAFFSPLVRFAQRQDEPPPEALVLLPVEIVSAKPEVVPVPDAVAPPVSEGTLRPEEEWWRTAWQVRLRAGVAGDLRAGANRRDSLAARMAWHGVLTDLLERVEPDSATASLLARLYLQEGFRLEPDLRSFLWARGYALAYGDLVSREAEMFDEHLRRTIQVTDSPDDKIRRDESRAEK
jgi:hypothetical protein